MKNSADLAGCYPPRPSASVDNTLLDLQNSSYPTQPHSIEDITRWREDLNFMFEWQEQYLTSERTRALSSYLRANE